MKRLIKYSLILVIFFSPYLVIAQDCVSSECHTDINQKWIVHVPVEEGDCQVCHQLQKKKHPKPKGPDFKLAEDNIGELCTTCHDIDMNADNLHPPVKEGMCTSCHNPHQSDTPNLLKSKITRDLCIQCHETGKGEKEYVHGPAAVGACEVCHSSHGSTDNTLLVADDVNTVCYDCHSLKEKEIQAYQNIHNPVKESCVSCHNAHESDNPFQLEDSTPGLCFQCHNDIEEKATSAKSHHKALETDKKCMNCHLPHGSNYQFNLQKETFDLCINCHDKPIKSGDVMIPSMKKFLERTPDWHGPIREKDCSGCHEPHGTANIRLLRYTYPAEFYSAFDVANYQLCYQCHQETNVLDATTTKLTNFRNGDKNLHYLHVNREKGRTCRACHQTHASQRSFHIRDSVPFGKWQLPINYSSNKQGGSCTPGCHKEKSYQR